MCGVLGMIKTVNADEESLFIVYCMVPCCKSVERRRGYRLEGCKKIYRSVWCVGSDRKGRRRREPFVLLGC